MITKIVLTSALLFAAPAFAQQASAPATRPAPAPLQIPNPHYVTIPMSIEVNASADKVWARVGKYCDIGEWFNTTAENTCKYLAGNGDAGSVRSVADEILVGKTKYSYTYAQAPRENTPYNLYHGTLQVIPVTATTSRLDYVLFLDNSMLPDDAARTKDLKNRETRFTQFLKNMKTLAEGRTLPAPEPAAPHAAGARHTPEPYLSPNPHYVTIPMQIEVNAPADTVWAHIGHYCDIGKLGKIGYPACKITAGTDGEYGVVRNIGREVLVGKTKYSYTYAQQLPVTGFYPVYHGTIEARATTPRTTTLYWTLVYDNSNLPDEAAKEKDIANRRTRFMGMLQVVKTLSEGGTLPD